MSKFSHYEACPTCRDRGSDRRGDNMGCYTDGSKHCYSCGFHVFPKHYKNIINGKEISTKDKAKLPNDFSRDVPARAARWLLQYGLPWSHWKEHCGYSETDERLIICVGEPLDFSLGRDMAVPNEGEKPRRKWHAYGNCHEKSHLYGPLESPSIICVEDVISAHKVAAAGYLTLPLFGTNVADCHLRTLLHLKLPIVMWLDKDQQGLSCRRGTRLSSLLGLSVRNINTDNDPKEIPIHNIKELLT